MAPTKRPYLDLWLPPSSLGNPEAERAGRLVVASATAAALFSGILAISRFGLEGEGSPVGRTLLVSIFCFALGPVAMRVSNSTRVGGAWVPAVGFASLLVMAYLEEGLRSEALYWIPFVPLVAGLVHGGVAALGFGIACAAGVVGLAWLHAQGVAFGGPPLEGRALLLHAFAAANAPLFGAFMAWLYEGNRRRTTLALDSMRRRSAALLSALPDAMLRIRADGHVVDLELPSEARERFRDVDLLGRRIEERFPEDIAKPALEQIRQTLASGRLVARDYSLEFAGESVHLELRTVPHGSFEVVAVVRDVTQRRRLDVLRDDFVATVSHELRTPLTSIHGSLRLIGGGAVGELSEEARELAEVASANSERLSRLIDDLLDMRKMEAGELELSFETVDLVEALALGLRTNEGYAESHGVELELVEPLPAAEVQVDADRLQQILANLLSNAIKYSPKGERVSVSLVRRGPWIEVSVKDRGPGIEKSFQDRVFERFSQADSGTTRRTRGTGLGLAICKRLVKEFGGRIGFETEPGEGTRFYFDLPARRPADPD